MLTSPIIRCIKEQLPNCEIHFLVKSKFVDVVKHNPYIDKIYSINNAIQEVIPVLRRENYSHIIDLHKNFRSLGIRFKLQKPSYSFNKLNIRKQLFVNLNLNILPSVHIVDRYFRAVEKLGISNDNKGLDFYLGENNVVSLHKLPRSHQPGYIGFVIGAKHNTKCLPTEKIISITKKIDYPFVLLGGKEDFDKAEFIANTNASKFFNACGKFNLCQSASLVKQAKLIMTHDTGLMHIASAFKKNIISFWGNTVPAFGMYPYMPSEKDRSFIFEVQHLSCRPCSKIGYNACPKKHFRCMNNIDENEVVRIVKNLLQNETKV